MEVKNISASPVGWSGTSRAPHHGKNVTEGSGSLNPRSAPDLLPQEQCDERCSHIQFCFYSLRKDLNHCKKKQLFSAVYSSEKYGTAFLSPAVPHTPV